MSEPMTSSDTVSPASRTRSRFDLRFWRQSPSVRAAVALAAAVLAVVLCAFGARAIVRDPLHPSGVSAGKAIGGGAPSAPSPGQSPVTEGAPAISAVPSGFVSWAVSSRFGQTQFALGQGTCASTACPVLIRTSNAGKRWQQVHAFAQADVSAALDAAQPTIQPAGAISGVRFISASTGFVFGADLWVTHDGGRSFTQIQHPGVSVLDVVVRAGQPLALTATGCIQGTCSGRLEVTRIPLTGAPTLGTTIAGVSPSDPVSDAGLVIAGRSVILTSAGQKDGSGSASSWRLDIDALTPLTTGDACNGKALQAVTGTAQTRIVALCDAAVSDSSTSYSTVGSDDGGATWHLIGAGAVTLPTQGHVSLAAGMGNVLVAVSGGPREAVDGTTRTSTASAIVTSKDGGKTWNAVTLTGGNPTGGFDSVIDDGVGLVALTRGDDAAWRGTRLAASWSRLPFSAP